MNLEIFKMSRGRPKKENKQRQLMIAIPESVYREFEVLQKNHSDTLGFEINKRQFMQVLLDEYRTANEIF
tara:strand:- start:194 stop:403 length:210 start_codon:yes stop_codon:yes gene_type:complete